MKYVCVIGVVLLFAIGCKSSEETQRDTITVPADTGTGWIYGNYGGVIHNDDCDSVEVFKTLLDRTASRLEAEIERYNVAIQALTDGYSVDAEASKRIRDSLQQRVDYYRLKLRTTVITPQTIVQIPEGLQEELNGLRANVQRLEGENQALEAQIPSFWEKVWFGLQFTLATVVLLVIGYVAIRNGLIRLPFGG